MPSILIQLDEATFRALNEVAPAAERERTRFLLQANKEAIRRVEFARIREGYLQQPDCAADADDWSAFEDFRG